MKELLTCPICQKHFQTLNSHIHFKHRLTTAEFLIQYPNTKLVSDSIKKTVSESCKKSGCGKWMKGYEFSDKRREQYQEMNSGKGNPFFGKKHSKKTRKQMSDNHADFTGDKNPLVKWLKGNSDRQQRYSESLKESWRHRLSDETYRKQLSERNSKMVSQLHLNGFNPYTNCLKGWFTSKKFNKKFYYQSSYELMFLEFCEVSNKIKTLQRIPFMIPYTDDNGIKRNYVADFFVNGSVVIEIKPKSMLDYNNNRLKIEAGNKYCLKCRYEFKLLTESELKNLEILI
jgi:hypothetical protein